MSNAKARLKAGIRRARHLLPRRPRPAILMYHRIGRESFDPWGLVVERDRFAAQVDWLARERAVLPLTEFALLHRERSLPRNAVSLTFDDGYASVLNAVAPLEKHELHATVFLPAQIIDQGRDFWWDELAGIVLHWTGDTIALNGDPLSVPPANDRDSLWPPDSPPSTPRQKLFQSVWSRLHAMQPAELEAAMEQLREQGELIEVRTTDRPLTRAQARSVSQSTIAFGSHGLTHPSLPALSADDQQREIDESIARCETVTGTRPETFAYPFGEFDPASMRLVERAGYACACATGDGFVGSHSALFALPRLRVCNWEPRQLHDMLGG
ncbi:MAG: polysaccharide deacetylase family protein [Sphingomicrobium sp.]